MTSGLRTLAAVCTLAFLAVGPVTGQDSTERTTIGGYGEVHYTNSSAPGASGVVSLARFVLLVGHNFSERITLHSELEIEDAKIAGGESGGEVALEQAYLDYRLGDRFTLRAGLLLLPIGIINETHEPPTFNGVRRPEYQEFIIPSTWRDIGVGAAGSVPGVTGLNYRVFLVNGLLASGFDAAEGIRGGRQEGRNASFANPALTGRLEWSGTLGLRLGVSGYHGGTANRNPQLGTGTFAAPITILSADARYDVGGFAFRAEAADILNPDAGAINQAFGLGVGRRIAGWYAEGAYNLLQSLAPGSAHRLNAFVRHERFDTHASVAAGATRDPALARRNTTFGLSYKPVWNVVFKADYQMRRNRGHIGEDNVVALGAGFQF